MDRRGSCWDVLMGKISQAERWILFVMLHRPLPHRQLKRHPRSPSLSLSLSPRVSPCSLDTVHLQQLPPPPHILLLLPPPPIHRYRLEVQSNTHTHTHIQTNTGPQFHVWDQIKLKVVFFLGFFSIVSLSSCTLTPTPPPPRPPHKCVHQWVHAHPSPPHVNTKEK